MHSDGWIQSTQGPDDAVWPICGEAAHHLSCFSAEEVKAMPLHAMSCLTLGQLAQLSARATAGLQSEQIRLLSPAQVVSLRHLNWISPQATAGLMPEQIAALSLGQFAELNYPDWLGPKAVASLTPAHIGLLSVHWGWMSNDWVAALSPQVMPFIEPILLAQLTPIATTGLKAAQLKVMYPSQVGALRFPQALSSAALSVLSVEQHQALRGNGDADSG